MKRMMVVSALSYFVVCFPAMAQLADGASSLQSELEAFAEPAAIGALILGVALTYFSDDNSLGKKVGYGALFISLLLGASTFVGLFG